MREKKPRCVITFATTSAAMAMERCCREGGLPGRLIPVPRSITAGCGLSWAAPPEVRGALEDLVVRRRLEISGIYTVII